MKCRSKNIRAGDRFVVTETAFRLTEGDIWEALRERPLYNNWPVWLMRRLRDDLEASWCPLNEPFERAT